MSVRSVGIVGASGYSGGVAARLVAGHPRLRLAFATSDARSGQSVGESLGLASDLRFAKNSEALDLGKGVDAILLATPAEVSSELGPALASPGRTVIDLSGAFRLASPGDYPAHYGFEHPFPERLGKTHYGLPELFGAPSEGTLVANPGCYPTAALLALAPLVRAGIVESAGIIVDAKSGTTGAGRQSKEEHSFAEVAENLRAYRLLSHQHEPEIGQKLGGHPAAPALRVTFTAHLLPVRRGLLATCYARPRPGVPPEAFVECLRSAYAGCPFVLLSSPEQVTLASVVGTNMARVGVRARSDVAVVVSAIDNLLKGASGQALQNLNLAFGFLETEGLLGLHRSSA